MKTYEMLWDCQFCGTEKLLGKTHQFCPNCGAPQNPDSRYFPPEEEKVAVEDHIYAGADVICPACGTQNAGSAVHCGACGAPLESGEQAQQINAGEWMDKDAVDDKYEQSRDVMGEQHERRMAAAGVATAQSAEPQKTKRRFPVVAIVAVVVVICGGIFYALSLGNEQTVVLSGHEWEREIRIDEYQAVRDGGWQDNVPFAAYNERCEQRQRDTRQVPDGETCRTERRDNGDGTFSEREVCETKYRSEPVYDTWCDYTIDRWEYERSVRTNGTGTNPAPYWGETNLACGGNSERLGCEREAGRDEAYTLIFKGDGDTYSCDVRFPVWNNATVESRWILEVGRLMGDARCGTLEQR